MAVPKGAVTYKVRKAIEDRAEMVAAPSAANAAGTPGQIAFDSGYIYVCVAANTWKRAALSTWS